MIAGLIAVIIVGTIAVMAIRTARVNRLLGVTQRPEDIEQMRGELLAYVRRREGVVDLAPFYEDRNLNDADRYAIQYPLQRAGILRVADEGPSLTAWLLAPVQQRVVLGERAHDAPPRIPPTAPHS